ncbi:NADPH-dependent FMN reductase [Aerococcus urinaehominis]|uniref:NADPH-dependent FMN reductase n=1 Tax=Aerococcus urinaehominis TaxID=128944 RepID=A0A109RHL1_9LACT|nr:NADPH-dependent FMN reductase [Aerococcus urinaehominis]AMB98740.1 NADPH-dependent FMN reductase [Aerococcus urinaehominis]SDM63198.1 NAD(P)H-dependent FMN reductase [Aerococcus urinaehominis]
MKKIVAIVGSNAKKSTNRNLLRYMQKHFAHLAEIELIEVAGLPMFTKPNDRNLPEKVIEMADKINQADGLVISTPEYNHTITSALSNALNWLSFYIYPLADKPVLITGASYGRLGSSRAQTYLRQILDSPDIRARVMPNSEFLLGFSLQAFDDQGDLIHAKDIDKLDSIFAKFISYIDHSQAYQDLNDGKLTEIKDYSWVEKE